MSQRISNHVILIGLRGSGKSTIGPDVARRLPGRVCIDLDSRIERNEHATVAELIRTRGEPAFRKLESETLARVIAEPDCVLAAGGGAVLAADNRDLMRASGFCVWLQASIETLADRIRADPRSATLRPALTSLPLELELRALLADRETCYAQTAHLAVDTDGHDPADVVAVIVSNFWRRRRGR